MVSVTKPSVSAIILLSGMKVSQLYQVNLGGGGAQVSGAIQGYSGLYFLSNINLYTYNTCIISFLRNMT
jgi:hypothetical protein